MSRVTLAFALVPYLMLAGLDTWMHDRARRVPFVESVLHGALAVVLALFLAGVFTAHRGAAWAALALFATLLAADELGFHRGLDRRERAVHAVSWAALACFVALWAGYGP